MCWHTHRLPLRQSHLARIVAIIQIDSDETLLMWSKERISPRLSGLISVINSAGSRTSSSASSSRESLATSPPPSPVSGRFGTILEEDRAAVYGH